MFAVDKGARSFIITNFITMKNEFINDGLIDYQFKDELSLFNSIVQLENLYFQVIKRNPENRNLTIDLSIQEDKNFAILNEVFTWIDT